ncbi:MAG: hypothetical protein M3680_33790, partial [Myxococcota bacterium]|nr:hypothetical protein [Myxococcota bacterium]
MGRTALYRDIQWSLPRAEVHLDPDTLLLRMPDGCARWYPLDGCTPTTLDGTFVGDQRRFVKMLVLERTGEQHYVITPPDQGAVAPTVVRVPEAPADASIVEPHAWDALADWVMGGGRLAAWAISDLARLARIASGQFAMLIGEVAAQRALELSWATRGPLRGGADVEIALQPFVEGARHCPRVAEA